MKSIVIISRITVIEMLKYITQENQNFKLDEINAKIRCPTIGLLSQKDTGNL